MTVKDKAVLITGANRGIGLALVEEALKRGASRVYAATRRPFTHPDTRVRQVTIELTSAESIRLAAEGIDSLDVLVNNAGIALVDDLSDNVALEQQLAINLFGTLEVTRAFLPALANSQGAVVNVASTAALAPLGFLPSYSISKAALLSLTQALRTLLAARGVRVHAVLAGPVDTEMSKRDPAPKASAGSVASAIFDGVADGTEEIFPDSAAQRLSQAWANGAHKMLERSYADLVQAS